MKCAIERHLHHQNGRYCRQYAYQHRSLTAPSEITAIDTSTSPPTLTVHFDGWGDAYNYAAAAGDPDLRYVGWCAATGRELQPPGPQVRGRLPRGARR